MAIQQSFTNQIQLAEDMASSLYQLADNLDYLATQVRNHLDYLMESGMFSEEVENYRNAFEVLFKPEMQDMKLDILQNNVQFVKKQIEALTGASINVKKSGDGLSPRNIDEFTFN